MALHEPSWRRKTTPCPFYSEGRCLFADSCNFLHTVKVRNGEGTSRASSSVESWAENLDQLHVAVSPRRVVTPEGPPSTPVVSIHSPQSDRGQPRSPRLSGLLLALSSVIGDDDIEEVDEMAETNGSYNSDETHECIRPANQPAELLGHTLQPPISPMEASFLTGTPNLSSISFLSDFPQPPSSLPIPSLKAPSSSSTQSTPGLPKLTSINTPKSSARPMPLDLSTATPQSSAKHSGSTYDLFASPFLPTHSLFLSPRSSVFGLPTSPVFDGFKTPFTAQSSPIRPKHRSRPSLHSDLDSPTDRQREKEEELLQMSNYFFQDPAIISSPSPERSSSPHLPTNHITPMLEIEGDFTITAMTDGDDSFGVLEMSGEDNCIRLDSAYRPYASPSPPLDPNTSSNSDTLVESDHSPTQVTNASLTANMDGDDENHTVSMPPSSSFTQSRILEPSQSPNLTDRRRISTLSSNLDCDTADLTSSRKVPFGFRQSIIKGRFRPESITSKSSAKGTENYAKHLDTPDSRSSWISERTTDETNKPAWMKPLRLSRAPSPSFSVSTDSHSLSNSSRSNSRSAHATFSPTFGQQSPSIFSDYSFKQNSLLSLKTSSLIPEHIRSFLEPENASSPSQLQLNDLRSEKHAQAFQSASPTLRWGDIHQEAMRNSDYQADSPGLLSSISEPLFGPADRNPVADDDDETYRFESFRSSQLHHAPLSAPIDRSTSIRSPSYSAIAPRPTLMFAIASDDVSEVARVLESGSASANDEAGPQSALAFALSSETLQHKLEIAKVLLAYGADPSTAPEAATAAGEDLLDPAIEYYLTRAETLQTTKVTNLIHGSFFRPLQRMAFELIGQDRALEQLYRVLRMHSQQSATGPLVVLCCGPSGHGKSLLARRFGYLLNVPTHTVNMTTLQSSQDLWQSRSMNPYEEPSKRTLSEFLLANEGQRCVVVLDDMDKTEDERHLWSLLAPWELGRCSVDSGRRHIDVHNVIWIGTTNVGQDVIFEHHANRTDPDAVMARGAFTELMALVRPRVSAHFGSSLLSRVTCVLPFVPFTAEEKRALACEGITLSSSALRDRPDEEAKPIDRHAIISRALEEYLPAEGARSLHRSVATQLLDTL